MTAWARPCGASPFRVRSLHVPHRAHPRMGAALHFSSPSSSSSKVCSADRPAAMYLVWTNARHSAPRWESATSPSCPLWASSAVNSSNAIPNVRLMQVPGPRAALQVEGRRIAVEAHDAQGDEYARLWKFAGQKHPPYVRYQEMTTRRIPIVVFEPLGANA